MASVLIAPGFLSDFIKQALAAIAGAGVGAWLGARFAFRSESMRAADERARAASAAAAELAGRRATAGNLAMFALSQIYNDLAIYEQQFMVPAKHSIASWCWLAPTIISERNYHRFEVPTLAFLLEVRRPGAPEMLMRLAVEQDRFATFLETVELRARFHQQFIPPIIERLQSTRGTNYEPTEVDLRAAVGERAYATLRNYLSDIETLLQLGLQSSQELGVELRNLLLAELPGQTIIGFEAAGRLNVGSQLMRARNEAARNEGPRPDTAS